MTHTPHKGTSISPKQRDHTGAENAPITTENMARYPEQDNGKLPIALP
jgi:hypothetical protein